MRIQWSGMIGAVCVCAVLSTGCSTMNHTEHGALLGSGIGAITGAVIGSHSGHAEGGALIGAATGALAGGLIGNAEDARVERDAALAYAHHEQQARWAAQSALSNSDVIRMAQNGVSDSVITGSIRGQGGRFDLSPEAIIALKQQGVSDEVIRYMQTHGRAVTASHVVIGGPPTVVAPPPVIYEAPPAVSGAIVISPRPRPVILDGPHCYRPRHHWHHHHWH